MWKELKCAKREGGEEYLPEFSPLQGLHPLQEFFSLQNYSPTHVFHS